MKKIILVAAVLMPVLAFRSGAEGVQSLIEVSKSMGEAKKELAAESGSFESVSRAVTSGAIAKGQAKNAISARYGDPVVVNEDFVTGRERWVYKSAGATFFKGPRIYLLFDTNGNLDEIKIVQ